MDLTKKEAFVHLVHEAFRKSEEMWGSVYAKDVVEHLVDNGATIFGEFPCDGCLYERDFPSHAKCHGCSRMYQDNYISEGKTGNSTQSLITKEAQKNGRTEQFLQAF